MKITLNIAIIAAVLLSTTALAFSQEPPVPPVLAFQEQPRAPVPPVPPDTHRNRGHDYYRSGQSALDHRQYASAIDAFNRVIEAKGDHADGALYWRAYSENKLGKRSEALATLASLRQTYAKSRWLEDAQALEVEVRQANGTSVSPENTSDEEMKLLVLNGLISSDPERTIPSLEKLLKSNNSPKVKERALFVLAQSRSPKSRDLIVQIAKGSYNPDLQAKAVEYLGVFGGPESAQALADIYRSTSDVQVKRSVLHGYMMSGAKDSVLSLAKNEKNPELRVEAIRQLGMMGGSADLLQLYTSDAPLEVKRAVLQGLFIGGNADKILEIARTDKDSAMRREAIRQLGPMERTKTGDALPALYAKESDAANKREILNALFIQQNAKSLIEIARKESDPNLKRDAVQKLSLMHSKEATDFLMEVLNK